MGRCHSLFMPKRGHHPALRRVVGTTHFPRCSVNSSATVDPATPRRSPICLWVSPIRASSLARSRRRWRSCCCCWRVLPILMRTVIGAERMFLKRSASEALQFLFQVYEAEQPAHGARHGTTVFVARTTTLGHFNPRPELGLVKTECLAQFTRIDVLELESLVHANLGKGMQRGSNAEAACYPDC